MQGQNQSYQTSTEKLQPLDPQKKLSDSNQNLPVNRQDLQGILPIINA